MNCDEHQQEEEEASRKKKLHMHSRVNAHRSTIVENIYRRNEHCRFRIFNGMQTLAHTSTHRQFALTQTRRHIYTNTKGTCTQSPTGQRTEIASNCHLSSTDDRLYVHNLRTLQV